jgi:hypothetical protein
VGIPWKASVVSPYNKVDRPERGAVRSGQAGEYFWQYIACRTPHRISNNGTGKHKKTPQIHTEIYTEIVQNIKKKLISSCVLFIMGLMLQHILVYMLSDCVSHVNY